MSRIVAIRRNEVGTIESYKLDDGRVLTRAEAVNMADDGLIEGVASFETRSGDRSIRSNRGEYDYSLDSLPQF
jgi:hypothetical protein